MYTLNSNSAVCTLYNSLHTCSTTVSIVSKSKTGLVSPARADKYNTQKRKINVACFFTGKSIYVFFSNACILRSSWKGGKICGKYSRKHFRFFRNIKTFYFLNVPLKFTCLQCYRKCTVFKSSTSNYTTIII